MNATSSRIVVWTAAAMIAAGSYDPLRAEGPAKDTPPPKEIAKKWRLTVINAEASVDGVGVLELEVKDGKVRLAPGVEKEKKWGYSFSNLEYADGVLRFDIDFRRPKDGPDWFEGRFDPKFPDRLWGVIGSKDPKDEAKRSPSGVRPAELNAAPQDALGDRSWAMQRVLSPGVAYLSYRLNKAQQLPLAAMDIADDRRLDAYYDTQILAEFAATAKPGRRKFVLQCMQVRSAEVAKAPPEFVESWLSEVLDYAAPYGPRYLTQLRGEFTDALSAHKNEDYDALVKRLRKGDSFPRK
jgi:hypothetical protein